MERCGVTEKAAGGLGENVTEEVTWMGFRGE